MAAAQARTLTDVELNARDSGDVLTPSVLVAYDDSQAIHGGECSDDLPTPTPEGPWSSAAGIRPDHSDANTKDQGGSLLGAERVQLQAQCDCEKEHQSLGHPVAYVSYPLVRKTGSTPLDSAPCRESALRCRKNALPIARMDPQVKRCSVGRCLYKCETICRNGGRYARLGRSRGTGTCCPLHAGASISRTTRAVRCHARSSSSSPVL